ncbi:unnamed protein product [Trichobilharzia szidati]|nr:unnamed protein product [Trichobilharzia szidati]
MKAHSGSALPPGSVLIQSGQTISQGANMATMQTNSVTSVPQNLQVWAPSPPGPIAVSGMGQPRNSSNLVTLPSGQTVLMANLVTTATTSPMSLPTSTLGQQQIQVPPVIAPGNPIVLPTPTPNGPLTTQLTNPTVIHGPNGPMSMALPGGIISSNPLNSFNNPSNAFVSTALGNMATDQPVHIAQIVDNQLHPGTACFTSNAGFQGMAPMNQMILDSSGFNLGTAQSPNKLINMSPVKPQTLVSSSMQPVSTSSNSFNTTENIPRSLSVSFSSDIEMSQSDSSISQAAIVSSTQNLPVQEIIPQSVQEDSSLTTVENSVSALVPVTTNSLPEEIPSTTENNQTNIDSSCAIGEQVTSVFTGNSLSELLTEMEPHLQLDPDVEEVMTNLANEFIANCAEKAQKIASHRGSSSVEGKDIVFCMEREWNIIVPGFVSDDHRPVRKNLTTEAHRQRLALIKKQIKKM